jgi:hypothetical protein
MVGASWAALTAAPPWRTCAAASSRASTASPRRAHPRRPRVARATPPPLWAFVDAPVDVLLLVALPAPGHDPSRRHARQAPSQSCPQPPLWPYATSKLSLALGLASTGDENGFRIFRYSGNRFRNFSIGFIGNGIFRKRNRFSEFSIGIGIGIGVVFYRPFPSVTGFCRKLPNLCLGIFRNCVPEFFGIVSRNFSEFSSM